LTTARQTQGFSPAVGALDAKLRSIRECICESVIRECEPLLPRIKAIVLTGSLARDEASFACHHGEVEALGDAEFLLISEDRRHLCSTEVLELVKNRVEKHLNEYFQVRCKIDLSPVDRSYLRSLPPHIFTYELKRCGRVIWGNREALAETRDFSPNHLSRTDAFRLLCNRLIEVLDFALQDDSAPAGAADLQYRITKLYLDMATSLLVFVGGYAPSYWERNNNLQKIASRNQSPAEGIDFKLFAQLVDCSTQRKLGLHTYGDDISELDLREAIRFAHQIWHWQLAQLVGVSNYASDRQLFDKWSASQPFWRRIRGWAYVVRACGWHHSYRQWPHWARLARQRSPRTAIYLAAGLLIFGNLGRVDAQNDHPRDLREIRKLLPAEPLFIASLAEYSVADLARAIVWNYRTFLERTRS